jgi:hypothetical protein
MRAKSTHGFKTGDMVRADASKGKKVGTYIGRVAVRASGSFNVQRPTGVVQVIDIRHCTILHRADGYKYHQQGRRFLYRLLPIVSAPISDDAIGCQLGAWGRDIMALSLPSLLT